MEKKKLVPALKSYADFAAASAALLKIDGAVREAKRLVEELNIRAARLNEDARRLLRNAPALPAMSDVELDKLASGIIAASGSISPGLLDRLRARPSSNLSDSHDAELVERIGCARASVGLLERASFLLQKKVSTAQTAAKAELFGVLRDERHAIALQIIAARQKWAGALRLEHCLIERIRSQGMDEILEIGGFPDLPRSDQESVRWMARILGTSESGVRMRLDDAQPDESAIGAAR